MATWRHGKIMIMTWGYEDNKDVDIRTIEHLATLIVSMSTCLHVLMSPCLHVLMSPCPLLMSPCLHVLMSPCPHILVFLCPLVPIKWCHATSLLHLLRHGVLSLWQHCARSLSSPQHSSCRAEARYWRMAKAAKKGQKGPCYFFIWICESIQGKTT